MDFLFFKVLILFHVLCRSEAGQHKAFINTVREWWKSLNVKKPLSCKTNFPTNFQKDLVSIKIQKNIMLCNSLKIINWLPFTLGWEQVCQNFLISMWREEWQGIYVQRKDRQPSLHRPWNAEVHVGGVTDRWHELEIRQKCLLHCTKITFGGKHPREFDWELGQW